jgi:hypothetical protein
MRNPSSLHRLWQKYRAKAIAFAIIDAAFQEPDMEIKLQVGPQWVAVKAEDNHEAYTKAIKMAAALLWDKLHPEEMENLLQKGRQELARKT